MKMKRFSIACAVALLIFGLGSAAAIVLAQEGEAIERDHVQLNNSIGVSTLATDVYALQCGPGTNRAQADVLDLGGVDGRRFTVTLSSGLGPSVSVTGPDGGLSTLLTLFSGPGQFQVTVSKTGGGFVEVYNSVVHCLNSIGGHPTQSVIVVQNQ